jgi:2-dehydro-3-deoxyglucarate aldolase/4-hydroxy-2-oxoheptanedioate aldolase
MGVRLKAALADGKLVRVFCVGHLCSPKLVEIIALHGDYEAIWLDQEHAGLTLNQIEQAVRAARVSGMDTFVRLAPTDYATIMRCLETGAGGIMAAQVRNARQVEEIVRWAKFHPRGSRGFNNTGIDGRFSTLPMKDYMQRANAETLVAIQIEHVAAIEDVDAIAAVPDVDVLFVGPADLSLSMGIPGDWEHPRFWEAVELVAKAAERHGVHWAVLPLNPTFARRCVDLGCRMLSLGLDVWAIQRGLTAFQGDYREYFLKTSEV